MYQSVSHMHHALVRIMYFIMIYLPVSVCKTLCHGFITNVSYIYHLYVSIWLYNLYWPVCVCFCLYCIRINMYRSVSCMLIKMYSYVSCMYQSVDVSELSTWCMGLSISAFRNQYRVSHTYEYKRIQI